MKNKIEIEEGVQVSRITPSDSFLIIQASRHRH